MRNIRHYLLLNRKELTATHYELYSNDFGEVGFRNRGNIVALGECEKYHSPLIHFIKKVNAEISDGLYEVVEGSSVEACIKDYKQWHFFK